MADEVAATQYTHGYGDQGERFSYRTASSEAGFILPYLKSGMSVLDCGCGSGSITLGLAEAVAPGEVVGIDISKDPIEHARKSALEKSVSNVRFEVASVLEIPFPDESFDAVFSHAVLEHLSSPLVALTEMRRVLKPGGFVGIADVDVDGLIVSPPEGPISEMFKLWYRVWEHNGGNPRIGKHLGWSCT